MHRSVEVCGFFHCATNTEPPFIITGSEAAGGVWKLKTMVVPNSLIDSLRKKRPLP